MNKDNKSDAEDDAFTDSVELLMGAIANELTEVARHLLNLAGNMRENGLEIGKNIRELEIESAFAKKMNGVREELLAERQLLQDENAMLRKEIDDLKAARPKKPRP